MAIFEINIPKDKIIIKNTIGRKIKEARGYCDITIEQLAALVDKPVQYIKSVEAGKEDIGFNELVVFADALDVTTDFLLGRNVGECPAEDIEYDNMFTREVLDLIAECSGSERYHLLKVVNTISVDYKNPGNTGFYMQYEPEKTNEDVEESMRIVTYQFRRLSNRERFVVLNGMRLALAELKAGIEVLFIPLPSCEVDSSLFSLVKELSRYKSGTSLIFK